MSVEGGLHRSLERASEAGCDALQLFTRSSRQWKTPPLGREEVALFVEKLRASAGLPAVAHASYLINMASPEPSLRERSLAALLEEIDRCDLLGLPFVIIHPGAHMGAGIEAGIDRIARTIDAALRRRPASGVRILLENTAGMGSSVGHRLEQISEIRLRLKQPERTGVCLDTCHLWAAGYDIGTEKGYHSVIEEAERLLGLDNVLAFHLNDCKGELGCRLDRHEHVGEGGLGVTAFWCLMNDPRFDGRPMILETPKGPALEEDRANLALLRKQMGRRTPASGPTVSVVLSRAKGGGKEKPGARVGPRSASSRGAGARRRA